MNMGDIRKVLLICLAFLTLWAHPSPGNAQGLRRDTVMVTELSPDVLKRSMQLQKEGLDALHHSDYMAADEYLHAALRLTPSTFGIYNNLGVIYARRYRLDEAANWFEKSLALAPFEPCVKGNLGLIRWAQKRTVESYSLLQFASERGCTTEATNYAMGIIELERGSPREASRNLSKVKQRIFIYRDFYLFLALRQLGKTDAAAKSLGAFRQRNPAPLISAVDSGK
jgi:tetratricopeptide (TPR) repeat protein